MTHTKWLLVKRKHKVYHGLLKPNRISENSELSEYGKDPPSRPSIRAWHKKLMKTGTAFDEGRNGRPRTSEETSIV